MSSVSWWKWSPAAAALMVTAGGAWWASRPTKPPAIVSVEVKVKGVVRTTPPLLPRTRLKKKGTRS